MSFTRAKPGGWALFEILTSAQMNLIDTQLENALDGANGGTYSPIAPLTWRNKWVIDTSIGGMPAGAALTLITDTGRTAILATGGADGGMGGLFGGGLRTRGIRTQGGSSDDLNDAGEGLLAQGGNNAAGGTGGGGVIGEGGEGDGLGGFGGSFTGGAAQIAGGTGGRGAVAAGGAGHTNGPGGAGGDFLGGAAPGSGLGGHGLFATGGTSVSGNGGNGLLGTGGIGAGAGGGHGVVGIGAGSTFSPIVKRAGGAFKAGTDAGAVGVFAEGTAGASAALWAAGNATGGPAIVASGLGTNDSVRADSLNGDGYALWARAKLSDPVRAPLHLDPQDNAPSAGADGDMYFGTSAAPQGQRASIYQSAVFPLWQTIVTHVTKESIKGFLTASTAAGVVTSHKAYNLTPTIVGAGTSSRYRCTFGLGFASANDYQPNVETINNGLFHYLALLTDVQPTYFEVGIWDLDAGDWVTLAGGGGVSSSLRASVAGAWD